MILGIWRGLRDVAGFRAPGFESTTVDCIEPGSDFSLFARICGRILWSSISNRFQNPDSGSWQMDKKRSPPGKRRHRDGKRISSRRYTYSTQCGATSTLTALKLHGKRLIFE